MFVETSKNIELNDSIKIIVSAIIKVDTFFYHRKGGSSGGFKY